MEGESYLSTIKDEHDNKVKRPASKLRDACEYNSRARSCNKIGEEVRKEIYDGFWKLNWANKKKLRKVSCQLQREEKILCVDRF